MKWNRFHVGWILKIWILVTVFTVPFLERFELLGWLALGGAIALWWYFLPEPPEEPVKEERLPFHDRYADRQIPRPDEPPRPPTDSR